MSDILYDPIIRDRETERACHEKIPGYAEAREEDVGVNKLDLINPPSLKQQALTALHAIATGSNNAREQYLDLDTIRKALEQLDD